MKLKSQISILTVLILIFLGLAFANQYYNRRLCSDARYTCVKTSQHDTWENLFPDDNKRMLVKKINRMNIRLHPGMTIAIPKYSNGNDLMLFSPFASQIQPYGKSVVVVDLSEQAFGAYDGFGNLINWGPISGGKGYCPDIGRGCHTPTGNFAISSKGGRGCVSSIYPVGIGGAPMPYCMFFHGGFALHGSPEVPGYNASHGCVRMFYEDAEWLNHEFTNYGTKVIVRQ